MAFESIQPVFQTPAETLLEAQFLWNKVDLTYEKLFGVSLSFSDSIEIEFCEMIHGGIEMETSDLGHKAQGYSIYGISWLRCSESYPVGHIVMDLGISSDLGF